MQSLCIDTTSRNFLYNNHFLIYSHISTIAPPQVLLNEINTFFPDLPIYSCNALNLEVNNFGMVFLIISYVCHKLFPKIKFV